MTGKDKFLAAFSPGGTTEFPAATCYTSIFLRDHWERVTQSPWWTRNHPAPELAARPLIDAPAKIGEDWFRMDLSLPRGTRKYLDVEQAPEGVFMLNKATGERRKIERWRIGGPLSSAQHNLNPPARGVSNIGDLDRIIEAAFGNDLRWSLRDDGRFDLPRILLKALGDERMPLMHFPAPLWLCYSLWGFEGMMKGVYDFPELIEHVCKRVAEDRVRGLSRCKELAPAAIWIEDCMTDMVGSEPFRKFNVDYLRPITEAIRAAGLYSIHYFCGNPHPKLGLLLDTGADALALEEGKKGFDIDIADIAEKVKGRMALLGNLDAYHILERGSEEALRREIARQLDAGRKNKGRFIMSIGSPVTPATPVSRVRRYCELVHELG